MADSLFDNRYRYDYIYPRGRSGETLRAVDTLDNDRPVVIKRPAPNDAPPIRAGQEVSILNERKALTRLAGHPVLTAFLGGGQFLVGGTAHQYIVMERGQGAIVADLVRELAQHEGRLPELEMLVIADALLDLLQSAHGKDIVYNDVDAKHLFWDRDHYRLKVIDWGNAVFLEGDEITPQGISRQSDIFQVGELLYFILSGGGRADVPRDAGDDFMVSFGRDAERISPRLQAIVSKAAHPNSRLRYRSINDLRKALTEYREPLERERSTILGRVTERLRHNRSKDELQGLMNALHPALAMDPGFPQTRMTMNEIQARLGDLEVAADLDAARIYMESANWSRAVDLLEELRGKARDEMLALVELLLDVAGLLLNARIQPTPAPILDAITLIFEKQPVLGARQLVTASAPDNRTRALQWLTAERIAAHTPDVLLLRPNLYRLESVLADLATNGMSVAEPRAVLAEIESALDRMSRSSAASLIELRDGYRVVVDGLTALSTLLETINARYNLPDQQMPFSALERALNAAMALADNMHVIGKQATTSPRDALNALDSSRMIDPTSPVWDTVARMLNGLYELLGSYQTYVPSADGSDLESWFVSSKRDLSPFTGRLFDDMLAGMVGGLDIAAAAWAAYAEDTIVGNRLGAVTSLAEAVDAVGTISPTLAGWLNQLRTIVTGAAYVERHTLYGGLGRALADGWDAFDRGRLGDAERLGQQAFEIARTDSQRFAAERLRTLAELSRSWVERNVALNFKGTAATLTTVENLYTADENTIRTNFAAQMPSKDTYLKAMGKGLVELYGRSGTAAVRILFMNFILLGTLDAHEGNLEDADFWREAAARALGAEVGAKHTLTRMLAEFIERRRDINAGAALLNAVNNTAALAELEQTRKKLEENPQARTLNAGIQSIRELETALRDWSDGEFRAAGIRLENALTAINEVEQAAAITLTNYRAWLMELQGGAAELHNQSRQMMQAIEARPDKPSDVIRVAHRRIVEVTARLLGDTYVVTVRGWRDTYESFLTVYTDTATRRSERLNRFNQLFRAMFIDRHPAYPLYRYWYDVTESAPEFPAPPTDEPTPQLTEEDEVYESEYRGSRYADKPDAPSRGEGLSQRRMILIGVGAVAIIVALVLIVGVLNPNRSGSSIPVTITDTPTLNAAGTQTALLIASATPASAVTETLNSALITPTLPGTVVLVTPTLIPTTGQSVPQIVPTLPSSATTVLLPTNTATRTSTPLPTFTPSRTPLPSASPTFTPTFTRTPKPTPTLPSQGVQGQQDLLALASTLSNPAWNNEAFSLVTALDKTYWRLGAGAGAGIEGDVIVIGLPVDVLETYYGNAAAARIRRVEADMTLTTFNPALLDSQQVFFGLLVQDAARPAQTAGFQVRLVQPGVVNLGQRAGNKVQTISQRSVPVVTVRVRLERDPNSGAITVFVNNEQLGQPIAFTRPDAAILPVLFVKNGDVIVSVNSWTVTLR